MNNDDGFYDEASNIAKIPIDQKGIFIALEFNSIFKNAVLWM